MPTEWGQTVLDAAGKPADPVTIDGLPMDQFVAAEQEANKQGGTLQYNDDGTAFDPNPKDDFTPRLFEGPPEDNKLFSSSKREQISANYAWNKGHEDAVLNQDPNSTGSRAEAYVKDPSVQDQLVEFLHSQYNDERLDYGVLSGMEGLPADEQLARINQELSRLNARKLNSKQNLLIHMMRSGYGELPVKAAQEIWMSLSVQELEALGENQRKQQLEQLRFEVDHIVAPMGEGFTSIAGIGEVIQQDFIPIYGAVTRVITSRSLLPNEVEIGKFRGLLPGEIRQEIREWFAEASHEDRVNYIRDIGDILVDLRSGPHSKHFTRYGIIENLMGIFTEDLLAENMPKESLDRWMGNLDVLLEAVYGVGVLAKFGGSFYGLFRAGNASSVRQAARAAGNHSAVSALDNQLAKVADQIDAKASEMAVVDMPRPPGLRDNMEVLPDGVKEVIEKSDAVRQNVLRNSNDITGQGLTQADKATAEASEIAKIDFGDNVHVNHRMTTSEELPDGTGIRISAIIGQTPEKGWTNLDELVDELKDLDPNLEVLNIVRRGGNGTIDALEITPEEFAKLVVKGEVPPTLEGTLHPTTASSRLFGGRKINTVSKDDLLDVAQDLDPKSNDFNNIMRELDRRRAGIDSVDPLKSIDGEEYFLRMEQEKYWHPMDKQGFEPESFASASAFRMAIAPNGKFADDIYGAFVRVYLKEQTLLRDFSNIYKPFHKLSAKDKTFVQGVFEWAEDFAKQAADTGIGRSPTYVELMSQFPSMTTKQMKGYAAIREGLDLQWELFNRRLYRDMKTRNLKSARSVTGEGPTYHGELRERNQVKSGMMFDPEANELKHLEGADIDDVYNGGGTVIKLDFPIDAPNGGKFDRVLVRAGDYEVGDLSRTPLNYYEGYHMRFYEDPVYIVKHTAGAKINGVASKEVFTEAIRTAGSTPEAERFLNRYGGRATDKRGNFIDSSDPNITYEIKPAKDINNVEGTLFQQQALYREGRLFWDKRNLSRLPDVNGNRAKVQDLGMALEKGTAMATRQVTHEDLFSTMKSAFGKQYADLIPAQDLATKDIKTIITELKAMKRGSTNRELRKRINDALEIAKYLRVQLGTDSSVIPALREAQIWLSNWIVRGGIATEGVPGVGKALKRIGGLGEQWGQSVDPFRAARSAAFHAFMVFRPVRQFILQSAQVSYLTALDPTYITTGRIFKDAAGLKRGIRKMTKTDYADGWNDSHWAAAMGYSKKEYKRLVEEFHRSGLLESVDVHSFNPTANKTRGVKNRDSEMGRAWYKARGAGKGFKNLFQKGFDAGERNNVTFSYLVALRRALAKNDGKSLTTLSRKEFDDIALEASNLALGMIRPNKFGYQGGAIGVTTQFISFSHKAMLGMLGANPAISRAQGRRIAATTYLMFGSNMWGGEDGTREALANMGLSGKANVEILPGITLTDLLAAGIIESGFNAILRATTETEKELDLSFLAPGANLVQIYESMFEAVADSPEKGILGPFYNPASGFLKGAEFTRIMVEHSDAPPGEKFLKAGDALLRNTLSGYNDANRAYLAYTMGEWLDKDGDKLPMRPTLLSILARGLLGVRTEEEMAYYRLQNAIWEDEENIRNAVDTNKAFLKELLTGMNGKKYGDEYIYEQVAVLSSLYEQWPDGIRQEIFSRSLTEGDATNPSIIEMLGKMAEGGSTSLDAIAPWIEAQGDMTPQEKANLLDFTKEIQAGYKQSDNWFKKNQLQDRNID